MWYDQSLPIVQVPLFFGTLSANRAIGEASYQRIMSAQEPPE